MAGAGTYIVVDMGKTLSKATLWSRDGRLLDRKVHGNKPIVDGGLRWLDVAGTGAWLREALAAYANHPIEAIIPVAHGAGVAAISDDRLLIAPLDYEQAIPDDVMAAYLSERDPFRVTGSPPLPDGLNLGSQLYWLERLQPKAFADATLVPWAQYWAWFLSGHAVSEITSLGCHTDLWNPSQARFSPMAERLGWAGKFAPVVKAGDVVGTIRPDLAVATGLPPTIKVLAGLHDSNAALLAAQGFTEIARKEATILSTGTWFVAMRLGAEGMVSAGLPEGRDTLVNVSAYGWPVPSARFMGGREIEAVIEFDTRRVDIKPDQPMLLASVSALLAQGTMMMPTLAPGFGPFPNDVARWIDIPDDWTDDWHARRAAICLYAALVADTSLDLIGSKERLLIEGRFAEAEVFVRALAALRPSTEVFVANAHNDVSFGALRLVNPLLEAKGGLRRVIPLEGDLAGYRQKWHRHLERSPA